MASYPCPKCGRPLPQSGEVAVDGKAIPIYSCDECLMVAEIFGERMEMALTFAVGDDGQPFDPASPDGRLEL